LDVRRITESLIQTGIKRKLEEWGVPGEISVSVEVPKQEDHGDFSTNAALQLAGHMKRKPRDVAMELLDSIRRADEGGWFRDLTVAGPGFINVILSEGAWQVALASALEQGERFGAVDRQEGERVLLEFVSANPTGPLHVGHGRGAVVGDALARILAFTGCQVTTEYYVNDVGNQIDSLGKSLYARYLQVCGIRAELPEDGYRGEYLVDLAREFREEVGDKYLKVGEEAAVPVFRKVACDRILDGIRKDLETFHVHIDRWFREESLHENGSVAAVVDELRERGLLYESEGAVYFKSESHGDEKDRVLVRADGRTTYFASDLAYHREKLRQGFTKLIDIWGADHHGYAPRVSAALKGLGESEGRLEILLVQFVSLIREGKAVQMSTRSGRFATLHEVIDEVGVDAARFFYLLRSYRSHLDFDLTLASKQSSENPVYYIQYVHARICSIFREAAERGIVLSDAPPLSVLSLPDETNLMKMVARFPDVVSESGRTREPHRIPFYLLDLAREFHAFYHNHRFLGETPERTQGRLALATAVRNVVSTGLSLLGVSAPERM